MAKGSKVEVQFRIEGIYETRFFMQESPGLEPDTVRQETAYQIEVATAVLDETEHIAVAFDIRLVLKKKPEVTLLHYMANMRYEVGGVEFLSDVPGKANIPTEIMHTLLATAYSTLRGVLYTRSAGSMLRNAILPLHDPAEFLKKYKKTQSNLIAKPSSLKG
jgi:hypothetical protein